MKSFLNSLKGKRTSRERDRTPSEAARSPKETAIRRTPSAAVSSTDAVLATPRYTPERQTPSEQYITPRPRAKSPSPFSEESPGSPHPVRPAVSNAIGRPGSPGELTERNVASVSNLSPWHQVGSFSPCQMLRRLCMAVRHDDGCRHLQQEYNACTMTPYHEAQTPFLAEMIGSVYVQVFIRAQPTPPLYLYPQPQPGPVARPIQDPYWDVQSRASSAGYSAAHSVATAHTAATGATGVTHVTYASAATAPAGGHAF